MFYIDEEMHKNSYLAVHFFSNEVGGIYLPLFHNCVKNDKGAIKRHKNLGIHHPAAASET